MNNCINCKHFKTPKAKVWKVGKCLKTSTHKLKGDTCEKFEAECLFQVGDEVEYVSTVGTKFGVVIRVNDCIDYPVLVQDNNSTERWWFTSDGRYLKEFPQVLFKVK